MLLIHLKLLICISDILRLWVASVDYKEDVRISEELIEQVKEVIVKLEILIALC